MLDSYQLSVHTLTLRQLATAEQIAEINGLPRSEVDASLAEAVAEGVVVAARGSYMISPAGRDLLERIYPSAFADVRSSEEIAAAMDEFEVGVNKQVLSLTTEWQTKDLDGERVVNDHADPEYDGKILDRLARVHDKARKALRPIAAVDPLVERFLERVGVALTRADGGQTDYVSGVRVDSVHTVWFQMHEHLLRLTGRERPE
jgi:hypothetical protein